MVLVSSKLRATSFRIGQISGGLPRGAWSTTDYLPVILKSNVSLGVLPETKELVLPSPRATLDVAFAEQEPPIAVNPAHPRLIAWNPFMQSISNAILERKVTSVPLLLVPFSDWLEKLESGAKDASEGNMKNALVLVCSWDVSMNEQAIPWSPPRLILMPSAEQ